MATVNQDHFGQGLAVGRSNGKSEGLIASMCVPARPEHVSRARVFVRLALEVLSADADACYMAQLMVSELVTNVVRYQRASDLVPVVLLGRTGPTLRIAVHDADPCMGDRSWPSEDSESGRGLVVVEALSDRWGVDRTAAGKSVWCELTAWPSVTGADGS